MVKGEVEEGCQDEMRLETVLIGGGVKVMINTMQVSKAEGLLTGAMPRVFGFSLCLQHLPSKD